jgi:uncharacterized protein YgbK (DUF1537 family)
MPACEPECMVIIADDLTGAAEVAGIAHRLGIATELCIGVPGDVGQGALVVDTEGSSANNLYNIGLA